MAKCVSCNREQYDMTKYLIDGKCHACREGFVLSDEDYFGNEKVWIQLDCFDRKIKVFIEPTKLDAIYGNDDINDFFVFKKAIEAVGGEIKDFYS